MTINYFTDGSQLYQQTTEFTINHKNETVDIDTSSLTKIPRGRFAEARNRWFRENNYEWVYKGKIYRTNDEPINFVDTETLKKNHNAQDFQNIPPMSHAALVIHNGKLYMGFNLPWQDRVVLVNKNGETVKSVRLFNCKNYHKVR